MKLDRWQLQALIAHEQGHRALHHEWIQAAFMSIAFPAMLLTPVLMGVAAGGFLSLWFITAGTLLKADFEIAADEYALELTNRSAILSALKRIQAERLWNWQLTLRIWILEHTK